MEVQKVLAQVNAIKAPRAEGDTPLAEVMFKLCMMWQFEWFIMAAIVGNTIMMTCRHAGQSQEVTENIRAVGLLFYVIFVIEAVIKILAFGKSYFRENWNRFDFLIVVGSTLGEIVAAIGFQGYFARLFFWCSQMIRMLRVGRLMRLMNRIKTMRELFATLFLTLPALGNITALLFLFFIFAVVGMNLFGKVAYYDANNEGVSFPFDRAMMSLLRFSTGENWNGFMHAVAHQTDGCVEDPPYDKDMCGFQGEGGHFGCVLLNGCGSQAGFAYFISFNLIIAFVFLNLFIGVILDGFEQAKSGNLGNLNGTDFEQFQDHWARFDTEAKGFIKTTDLKEFLRTLFPSRGASAARRSTTCSSSSGSPRCASRFATRTSTARTTYRASPSSRCSRT